jgi:hypothetical protein
MAKLSTLQKKYWFELLDTVKKIEGLGTENPYPTQKVIKDRLTQVLTEDYKNHKYSTLKKKVNALQKDERKRWKEEITTDKSFNKFIEDIDDLLTENKTLKANFTIPNKNTESESERSPHHRFMDLIAITYGEAESFIAYYQRKNIPPTGFEGKWVSVVRSNNRQDLLFAPITVTKNPDHSYHAVMQSKHNTFEGKVYELNGCLQMLFDNGAKMLLLSFRMGAVKFPKLLQGTFSGISSSGAPIAGVEWLIRPDELPPELEIPSALRLTNGTTDWKELPEPIQIIFRDFDTCYLKTNIDKISSCSWTDLEELHH